MKKALIILLTAVAALISATAVYVYVMGGALPFGITLPGQPGFTGGQAGIPDSETPNSLASAVMDLFSSTLIIKDGEIAGMGDAVPLLSSASGLFSFAPYFPQGLQDYRV